MGEWPLIISLLAALFFSAFFSGVEISFISGNRLKLELDKNRGDLPGKWLNIITKSPSRLISTLLIGNNIALVLYGIIWGNIFDAPLADFLKNRGVYSDGLAFFLQTLISTMVIIVFGEYIPKTVFSFNPNAMFRIASGPVALFQQLLYYPVSFSIWLSRILMRLLFGKEVKDEEVNLQRRDLGYYLQELTEQANDNRKEVEHEVQILRNALEFPLVKARECMVPRPEIVALPINTSMEELREKFITSGHSKIMIYREGLDDIIGFVHSYALFKKPTDIESIVIPVPYVPETMHVKDILTLLIQQRRSLAVVVDEYGGTSGLISMEDIIEEIFGEIEDEHDAEVLVEKDLGGGKFLFSGRIEMDYINEKYGLNLLEDDQYETLAGYVLHHHQDIPKLGEEIAIGPHIFRITAVSRNRINEILLMTNRNSEFED